MREYSEYSKSLWFILTLREYLSSSYNSFDWDQPNIGIRAMASNKERIENLESGLGSIQDTMSRIWQFSQIETAINKISEILQANKNTFLSSNFAPHTNPTTGCIRNPREEFRDNSYGGRPQFISKLAKIFLASLEMIRPNGSQGWNNSLITRPLPNCRKCHWLPFILKEKPTNGGNSVKGLTTKRKGDLLESFWRRDMGQIWSNGRRGFWRSIVKGRTNWLLAWLSKRVWTAR